ncbi:MAG: site-specific integrase [Acidobacteriota bacterium]|nr:site-specific integrase [Acidobacteriota bacterium]
MKKGLTNRDRVLALPYVHQKDERIYVRVPYQDAYRKWKSKEKLLAMDATPDDAILAIAKIKNVLEMNPAAFDSDRMTFDELLTQYKRAYPKLPKWYEEPLSFFFGRKIRSLTYADVKRFKEVRDKVTRAIPDPDDKGKKIEIERKPATINREMETLRGVLLFAVRHGWLDRNPMTAGPMLIVKGEEDRRDRIPTLDEEARILAVCVAPRGHLKGLIIATADTGLRRSALLSLEWPMVDWERQLLSVPSGNRYKRRPKLLGITNRLFGELQRLWLKAERPTEGKVFKVVADFKRSYRTACRLADVQGLRFNDFRHKFATDLMEADISKELAMKVSGHSNADIHDIYTNVDARLARQVADALDKLHAGRQPGSSQPALDEYPLATELPQ